jgi:hypothetical protein
MGAKNVFGIDGYHSIDRIAMLSSIANTSRCLSVWAD